MFKLIIVKSCFSTLCAHFRWSIMVYERSIEIDSGTKLTINSGVQKGNNLESTISMYYNYIMSNLDIILQSNEHEAIVNTAKSVFFMLYI